MNLTALLTLNSFDNMMYSSFKVIMDKNHPHISKDDEYLTLKVPKSSYVVSYYFNLFLTTVVTLFAIFTNAWYNRSVCEKITIKDSFVDKEDFLKFWGEVYGSGGGLLGFYFITLATFVVSMVCLFLGMPLVIWVSKKIGIQLDLQDEGSNATNSEAKVS